MFCCQSNNSIKKIQERALRIINDDPKSGFQDFISKHKEYTIHQRNLQTLLIEIYEIIYNIAPPVMNSLFLFRVILNNIKNFQVLSNGTRKTVR